MNELLPLITVALQLLKTSGDGQERRNLRVVKRTYKQLKREFKKDGFSKDELEALEQLRDAILDRTLQLGKKL